MSRKSQAAEVEVGDALKNLRIETGDEGTDEEPDDEESDDEQDDDGDDADADDEESDDEPAAVAAPVESDTYDPMGIGDKRTGPLDRKEPRRSRLRDALYDESEKRRRIAPPPPAPRIGEAHSQLHVLPPEPEDDPVVVIRPDRVRKEKPQIPPNTKKLGALAKKLPGAERLRISRRLENGQLGYCGDYSMADLSGTADVETFIAKWLKPKFGYGTYKIVGIDAAGNLLDGGEVVMLEPEGAKQDGVIGIVSKLIEQTQQQQREFMEQAAARVNGQQSAPDPINMLEGLHRVHQGMTQPANTNASSDMATVLATMMQAMQSQQQQTMQMMAAQQAQAQAAQNQMTQLLVAAMAPKEDPAMKAILAELVSSKKSSGEALPLPMPPPPASPLEGLEKIVAILATVMQSKGGGDDEVKEILKQSLMSKEQQALTPKDVISLMHEMQNSRGTDDFRKSLENMSMMLQVANNLKSSTETSGSATFFDALASLFSNRDFAGSIAQSIRSKSEQTAANQRLAQEQAVLQQRMALLQQVQAAKAGMQPGVAIPLHPAGMPPGMPPGTPPGVVQEAHARHAALQAQQAALRAQQGAVRAESAADVALSAEERAAIAGATAPAQRLPLNLPPIPNQTPDHVTQIASAVDAAGRIEKSITMLIYWGEHAEFRPLIEMLLSMVKAGDKREAIKLTRQIFETLSGLGFMPPALATQVVEDFRAHFNDIQANLADIPLESEQTPNPFEEVLDDEEDEDDEEDDEGDDEEDAEDDGDEAEE